MADTTTAIPQGGTIPQTTAATPIPPAQDLQINLEEATPTPSQNTETTSETSPKETIPSDLNLDLDLDLPEAPKNDDRLKAEDQKNTKKEAAPVVETPAIVEPVIENIPVIEETAPVIAEPVIENIPVIEETAPVIAEPVIENIPVIEETAPVIAEPVIENIPVIEETAPVIVEPVIENIPVIEEAVPVVETLQPATTVETEQTTTASTELQNDMNMISELESHPSAGGLSPEAIVAPQAAAPVQQPKTFNLDEMFSTPPQPVETVQQPVPTPMETQTPTITPPQPVEQAVAPIQQQPTPPFMIPTTPVAPQAPIQNIEPIAIPAKNTSVKILLFGIVFAALGFATFFILKTMYPIEFANMFGGTGNQAIVQDLSNTEITGDMLSGSDLLSGTEVTGTDMGAIDTGTGSHESAIDNGFGELNDLTTTETTPPQTDVSRLTDYVNQGNDLLAQGKTMNNNTVVKYGLYISKKATTLLQKIANEEQIDNISGYFAQFDQYIGQLKDIIGQPTSMSEQSPSATSSTNGLQTSDTGTDQYNAE